MLRAGKGMNSRFEQTVSLYIGPILCEREKGKKTRTYLRFDTTYFHVLDLDFERPDLSQIIELGHV